MQNKYVKKPIRVTRTYTQKMVARAEKVFPLLCPIKEIDWVEGWPLKSVLSESGFAEENCIFYTENENKDDSIWMITRHLPESFFVEMVKITLSETACKLRIQLKQTGENSCDSTISYTHIALSDDGEKFVKNFTDENYEKMMKGWESQINNYLLDRN